MAYGIWHAYIVPIREEDMTGWCIKEDDFAITVNKSSFSGLNSNYEYAASRGPGVVTLVGDVLPNGLVTGDVLGDYMGTSKWFAIMDNNAVGVGLIALLSLKLVINYNQIFTHNNSHHITPLSCIATTVVAKTLSTVISLIGISLLHTYAFGWSIG